ncbi:DUF6221 family protein [Streptomyces griseus]|uniref:DUF6221 family protein n=1 Tax=Streptomyces griseus TaxID=1911 RepID=UPI0033A02017
MDDLVQFLRARLDEDEQAARAATWDEWDSAHWTARPPQASYERYTVADHLDDGVVVVTPENADADGVGQHVARQDPARVLREVEAKRRILDEVVPEMDGMTSQIHGEFGVGPLDSDDYESLGLLRLLGLPYADHPDYQDTWRP